MDLSERVQNAEIRRISDILSALRLTDRLLSTPVGNRVNAFCSTAVNTSNCLIDLCHSGNTLIDKTILVFSELATEIVDLIEESRESIFDGLLLYGEFDDGIEDESTSLRLIVDFLPFLQKVALFVNRCSTVAHNLFTQIYAFFGLRRIANSAERILWRCWRLLGDLVVILATVDEIFDNRPQIEIHFDQLLSSISIVNENPRTFGVEHSVGTLRNILIEIQEVLFKSSVLESFCSIPLDEELLLCKAFAERFRTVIADRINKWDKSAIDDIPDRHRLILLSGLSVLYFRVFHRRGLVSADRKLITALCGTQKRIVAFYLIGDILFTPLLFLQTRLPPKAAEQMDKKCILNVGLAIRTMLDQQADQLARETQIFNEAIFEWKTQMRQMAAYVDQLSTKSPSSANHSVLLRCNVVLKGARLADRATRLIKCVLNGHLAEDRPISKSNAQNVFKLIEAVKSVAVTLNFHWPSILEWCLHSSCYLSAALISIINNARTELKTSSPYLIDISSALKVAADSISLSPSKSRLIVCGIAMEIANYTKSLRGNEIADIDEIFQRLDPIVNIGQMLSRVTDCSFFYWHRSLCSVYFESLFEASAFVDQISLFIEALNDSCSVLRHCKHMDPSMLIDVFRRETLLTLRDSCLDRLCSEIENDVRLTIHSRQDTTAATLSAVLFDSKMNPMQSLKMTGSGRPIGAAKLSAFLNLPALHIAGHRLHIKEYVESRLQRTFYELTAVALHDSESYARMRICAEDRYGLKLTESRLPHMNISQGLDILRIVANFNLFASNYSYNLNEQIFFERITKSRSLNIMRIPSAVSSIKTHGLGVISTAINCSYRFLRKKFRSFSRFLFDEQIRSQLVKDIRYYKDSMEELNQMYPVRRAERFNSSIAKLGTKSGDLTPFDRFRDLLTQIGNTVGFVRMLCSAAMESDSFGFLSPENIPQFLSEETDRDAFAKMFRTSPIDASDFIELLVRVFAKEFRSAKFAHLRNFFIIVPPLCINFVEHIYGCRSRLSKRIMLDDVTFVDDGFCMGVSYTLALLNQTYFFESLNWFQSVEESLGKSKNSVEVEIQNARKNADQPHAQTLTIRLNRLRDFQSEFRYLRDIFNVALMIFKNKDFTVVEEESFLEDF